MIDKNIRIIARNLGIKFDVMIIARAELVYLRNDGFSVVDIAKILNVPKERAYSWFNKQSLMSDEIMSILEKMYFQRVLKNL